MEFFAMLVSSIPPSRSCLVTMIPCAHQPCPRDHDPTGRQGAGNTARQANIGDYLGDRERRDVLVGVLAGFEEHGDRSFRRYRFASLDGRPDRRLEIAVPPEGINTTGYVRVVRTGDGPLPGAPAARLILKPSSVTLNPAMAPAEYFRRYHPGEAPDAYGQHSLFLTLYPERSVVIHARAEPNARQWRWVDAVNEL